MPLPSSGTISLLNIQTEYGGASPTQINEYYAGGTYVPAGTSGTSGPIPSTGTLKFSDFYGSTIGNIYLRPTHTLRADMGGIGGTVTTRVTLFANGVARGNVTKSSSTSGSLRIDGVWSNSGTGFIRNFQTATDPALYPTNEWVSSGTVNGSYFSTRATWTPTSGSATPVGPVALGDWTPLNANVNWTLTEGGTNDTNGVLLLEIAKTADTSTVIASTSVTMIAISAP